MSQMTAVPGRGHSEPKGSSLSFALLGLVWMGVGWWGKVETGGVSEDSPRRHKLAKVFTSQVDFLFRTFNQVPPLTVLHEHRQ